MVGILLKLSADGSTYTVHKCDLVLSQKVVQEDLRHYHKETKINGLFILSYGIHITFNIPCPNKIHLKSFSNMPYLELNIFRRAYPWFGRALP